MEALWFWIIALMIVVYVVLDGFDLGVGIIYFLITKSDKDRSHLLKTIAHVWDGNEVWLLAGGGVLFLAFPAVYAASFSGFYLPLMIVLWLLMLRGGGIELRHYVHHPLWKKFWDTIFSLSSTLLAVFLGAALGNVVRGVPLTKEGFFFEPLWTTFTVGPEAGILDWFTVMMGLVALATLTLHGATYVSLKTTGEIQERARAVGQWVWWITFFMSVDMFLATWTIHPDLWANYSGHIGGFIFPLAGLAGILGTYICIVRKKDAGAFWFSTLFIVSMLAATAFAVFPNLLQASTQKEYSITIYNSGVQGYGLRAGLIWWIPGIILAALYFTYLFRSFRGKIQPSEE